MSLLSPSTSIQVPFLRELKGLDCPPDDELMRLLQKPIKPDLTVSSNNPSPLPLDIFDIFDILGPRMQRFATNACCHDDDPLNFRSTK